MKMMAVFVIVAVVAFAAAPSNAVPPSPHERVHGARLHHAHASHSSTPSGVDVIDWNSVAATDDVNTRALTQHGVATGDIVHQHREPPVDASPQRMHPHNTWPPTRLPRLPVSEIKRLFRNSVCQIFTPFLKNGSMDVGGVRSQVTHCVQGANVSVVLLTSADSGFAYMTEDEIRALTSIVVEQVRAVETHRTVVVAAAPITTTDRVVAFAEFARNVGADVVMVRPMDDVLPTNGNQGPHVYQEGLVDLYTRAAMVMPIQIVGCRMGVETAVLEAVARNTSNYCCHKLENGNATYTANLLRRPALADVVFMYGGGSATPFLPPLLHEGAGATSGMSVLAQGISPLADTRVWPALVSGDAKAFNESAALQASLVTGLRLGQWDNGSLIDPSFADGFPGGLESGIRAALEVQGVSARYLRSPEDHASDEQLAAVARLLKSLGWLHI